ncbi:ABC transporter family substrate-binding protein [Actinomycetaceae bacterium MB13-C1-2]|nr:ABC transporter family substrate-binding protein [Actinomycetaceae bacterium MB13-C1-2]
MRRKVYGLAAVAAAGALALAGCSSSGGGQSGQSGDNAGALETDGDTVISDNPGINPQPRDALAQGGELRQTISAMPTYWNPIHQAGNNVDNNRIGNFTGVRNWIYAADASFVPNPNYVKDYELKVGDEAPNGKQQVILHLNEKAIWGDDTPITWKDYEATGKACGVASDEGDVAESDATEDTDAVEEEAGEVSAFECASRDGWDHWESVSQGDTEYDVVIDFKDVFPDWSAALSEVYPASGVSDADTFNTAWSTPDNKWWAGPYKFASVDEAQQTVYLEPNEKWWGEAPLLDSVSFRAADPATSAAGFANGEVDVLEGIIDAQQYLQAETRADAEIRRAGGLTWRHFTFNGDTPAISDPAVRVAVSRGVDRASITEADLAGIPDLVPADLVLENHFFMPGQEGYQDNGSEFGYDPERAQKELDELGWKLKDGDTVRTNDAGDKLTMEYVMMPDISTSKTEGELLQSQLAEIGVEVTIKNVSSDEFWEEYVFPGKFGVVAFGWQGTPYPMANIGQIYSCGENGDGNFGRNGGSNFANVCVPEIEELAAKIAVEPDHDKRVEMTNEVDKLIWENGMVLPIYQRMEMTAVPANLANFGAFGLSNVQAENIGYMK